MRGLDGYRSSGKFCMYLFANPDRYFSSTGDMTRYSKCSRRIHIPFSKKALSPVPNIHSSIPIFLKRIGNTIHPWGKMRINSSDWFIAYLEKLLSYNNSMCLTLHQ